MRDTRRALGVISEQSATHERRYTRTPGGRCPATGVAGWRAKLPVMALPRLRTFAYASWVVVAVLAIWAVFAWTRQAHAMTPWSLRPERISYRDRDYQRNPAWAVVSGKELRDLGVGTGHFEQVGRIPPIFGRPVLAPKAVPVDGWAEPPCTTALLLEVGDDSYVSYGLLGGP